MLRKLVAVLAASAAFAAPAAAQKPAEINFGIISTESSQNLKQDWGVLLADMQKRLGIKVNAFFAPDYAGVIEAHALQQGAGRLVRQQVGHGSGGPRQRRGVRAADRRGRRAGLLVATSSCTRTARSSRSKT